MLLFVYVFFLFHRFIHRNIGMGTSTSAARVGSFLSPYIVYSVSLTPVDEAFCLVDVHVFVKTKCTCIKLLIPPGLILL